jgi:transposase
MGNVVGCDVSKDWIDAESIGPALRLRLRMDNNAQAIERFSRELPPGSLVGMEATGQMHELLARKLVKHGHTVFVVNPRWIHFYAKGVGIRGKTDRSDASLIARFIASESAKLHAYELPSKEQQELRKLLLRRRTLVKLKAATRQSLGIQARALVRQFDIVLEQIERRIAQIIKGSPDWQALAQRLGSEPGVGPIVAAHLVQVFTRFPFKTADAFIAHTGLDPRPNDSGQKHGRRWLTHHGDSALRTMLYMAALGACKRPEWHAIYEANRSKGLSSTAALIVVARKLARIAYSLFKSGGTYDATRVARAQPG